LDAGISDLRSSGVTMHVNKVHHVTTINRVAEDLGEDEDWLRDVANEMEIEDGAIWVYGVGEDGVMAFTDFGIETLIELIRMYKEKPQTAQALKSESSLLCGLRRMDTIKRALCGRSGTDNGRRSPRLRLHAGSPSRTSKLS
jgi:hypothetical protein